MSIFELIGVIANIVASLTAIVAILFVIKQTRQLDNTLQSQVYQGLIDNSLKIDELLMEHPEYRKYVYGNEPINENTPDIDKIISVMEFMTDIADHVLTQEEFIPKSERIGWRIFAEEILSSPAARYFLEEHGTWYSGKIPDTIDKQEKPQKKNSTFFDYFSKMNFREKIKKRASRRKQRLHVRMGSTILVKSYISPKVRIAESKIHGFGMFAKTTISKGEVVFIKGGHIVRKSDLYFEEPISSYLPIDDQFFIGAVTKEEEDSIKLFVNHSCEPNCGVRGEITFVALRRIQEGEELTCDYAMIDNEDYEFECNCGSSVCRKKITGFDWKIEELQIKYSDYFARYLLDKITAMHGKRQFRE